MNLQSSRVGKQGREINIALQIGRTRIRNQEVRLDFTWRNRLLTDERILCIRWLFAAMFKNNNVKINYLIIQCRYRRWHARCHEKSYVKDYVKTQMARI